MKKNINDLEKTLKKLFIPVIDLSIPFILHKKYFFHHYNSIRYLDILEYYNNIYDIQIKIMLSIM